MRRLVEYITLGVNDAAVCGIPFQLTYWVESLLGSNNQRNHDESQSHPNFKAAVVNGNKSRARR